MATVTREYRKPVMTNMPVEIGEAIFAQILSTPAPDDEALRMQVKKFEKKVQRARRRSSAQENTSR